MSDPRDPRHVTQHLGSRGLSHLAAISIEYERMADEYGPLLTAAARAEASYKAAKAKFKMSVRAERERVTDAEAETRADADDTIADLLMQRLTTRAVADSHLQKLYQLKAQNENGRSYVSTERTLDQFHAQGRTGAA